ncbi:MAG: hypothetical protein M2R45_03909 [Verrucomicrobia subdivision 3 bacterium]|nr:hypothetical protein [Limisphaerales bacterium]MCS1417510.1 hypothetical protein [Limisphaerales bacterium]
MWLMVFHFNSNTPNDKRKKSQQNSKGMIEFFETFINKSPDNYLER